MDFYCVEEWLAVELDGEVHRNDRAMEYDAKRTAYLKSCGVKVIRFENFLVYDEIEFVLWTIERPPHLIRTIVGDKQRAVKSDEQAYFVRMQTAASKD